MTKLAIYDHPDYERVFVDYDLYRAAAGKMRAETLNDVFSKGASAIAPSRRTLRNLALAFLVATGAFWAVMLNDPPKTVAADPSTSAKGFSPLELMILVDLPTGDYVAH